MSDKTPRVSIGVPVYNGEEYVGHALETLLVQTYTDFELIISDNASNDRTGAICEEFAARDSRVRYHRADENRGAAWNYNRLVELARGQYFKWAACDDVCRPEFIERCVEVLDRNPDVAWCFPRTTFIDASGDVITEPSVEIHSYATNVDEESSTQADGVRLVRHPAGRESVHAHERFAAVLSDFGGAYDHYGLIRTEVLRSTGRERPFLGSDKVLVAELSLRGRFVEIPEVLMLWRHHDSQLGMQAAVKSNRIVSGQFERRFFMPRRLRCVGWYLRLILEADISASERAGCLAALARTTCQPRRWLLWLQEFTRRASSSRSAAGLEPNQVAVAPSSVSN